jgi:hypothetical protein
MSYYVPRVYTELLPITNAVTVFFTTTNNRDFDILNPEFLLIILDSENSVEESVQFPIAQTRLVIPHSDNETTDAFSLTMQQDYLIAIVFNSLIFVFQIS